MSSLIIEESLAPFISEISPAILSSHKTPSKIVTVGSDQAFQFFIALLSVFLPLTVSIVNRTSDTCEQHLAEKVKCRIANVFNGSCPLTYLPKAANLDSAV